MNVDLLEKEILALSAEDRLDLLERVVSPSSICEPTDECSDSVSEALRRKEELIADPSIGMSWNDIKTSLGRS